MSMSQQGNKRAGDNPSASDGREEQIPKRHCATASSSTAKELDAIEEFQKIIEKIFLDLEKLPQTRDNMTFINELKEIRTKMGENLKEKVVIGVLGRTGAGKSSLVNAILGEKRLLASGTVSACTSVIIQVEANMANSNYEAEIQFISEKDWKEELQSLVDMISDHEDTNRQMLKMAKDKIQALYGDNGVGKDFNTLVSMQNFSGIFASGTKSLKYDNASDVSREVESYVRSKTKTTGIHYWPLVKLVTIKVPHSKDLLEHIVLVDVPGSGDWNTARDKMWEEYLSKCSSVWVVADINRASSDSSAWDILENCVSNLGPGGQCQRVSFICTKTDIISRAELEDDDDERSITGGQAASVQTADERKRNKILKRNAGVKIDIEKNFDLFKQLGEMEVFTVSSDEFQTDDSILSPDDTEIPKLRALLKKLNDQQSKKLTNDFIIETYGIISRIQMTNSEMTRKIKKKKSQIKEILETNQKMNLGNIKARMSVIQQDFQELLSSAADESVALSERRTKEITAPGGDCRGYHKTLKAVCKGEGYCRSKNGNITDMNATLTRSMYDAIDEKFQEIFSMEANAGSVPSMIEDFNISENLINCIRPQYLDYIMNEQLKAKRKLREFIVQEKKEIYKALKKSITHTMQPAYAAAAEMHGKGSMKMMQTALENHIGLMKNTMFYDARDSMLTRLEILGNHLDKQLRVDLMDALMQPLTAPSNLPLPDVSEYYEKLKKAYEDHIETQERRQ